MSSASSACALARSLLAQALPRRYEHVAGVAEKVRDICAVLDVEGDYVVAAAWLHDIGYAPRVVETGFHALDGARYARRQGYGDQVVGLIAHHSCAQLEAELRGLDAQLLEEFPLPESPQRLILTAADMSVGPGGKPMTVEARLADIRRRYAPSDVVNQFLDEAEPELRRIVAEVDGWLLNPSTALLPRL